MAEIAFVRRPVPVPDCTAEPLNDQTPYYEWFWFNLSLGASLFPGWTWEQLVEDAARMADKHHKDNIYCLWHGRQFSQDGTCPCTGHPAGVHRCPLDPEWMRNQKGYA